MGEPVAVILPRDLAGLCCALPALERLRDAGHELHLFVPSWALRLVAALPDRVAALPAGRGAAVQALRGSGARLGVLLDDGFAAALLMHRAGIRAAGHGGWRRWWVGRVVGRVRGRHPVESMWAIAGVWCRDAAQPPAGLRLPVVAAAPVAAPYAVLTAMSGWPGQRLLIRLLAEHLSVVGLPGCKAQPGLVLLNAGEVAAYLPVMAGAQVVIGTDAGLLHLAAAAGAPVVQLRGPPLRPEAVPWTPRLRVLGDDHGWPTVDTVAAAALAAA